MRTVDSYNNDVLTAVGKNNSKGVKANSCLNELSFFHVCQPGLPPCLAHDILEGILQYDMQLFLNYLVWNKWFSYNFLNERIKQIQLKFKYGNTSIPLLKQGKKLCGSASENLKLLQILPIVIHDCILHVEDEVWQMILNLRKICDILLAQYMYSRKTIFSEIKLRPKHHYLCHYPYLIVKFGPLKHSWTMRFESKHKYFKNIIKHAGNYKNVTLMMSERHQYLQALHFSEKNLFSDYVECDNAVEYNAKDFSLQIQNLLSKMSSSNLLISNAATYRNIEYKRGQYICIGKDVYDRYVLSKISHIVIKNDTNELYFMGSKFPIYLNENGVYEPAEYIDNLLIIPYSEIISFYPILCYEEKKYFIFTSTPFDLL